MNYRERVVDIVKEAPSIMLAATFIGIPLCVVYETVKNWQV